MIRYTLPLLMLLATASCVSMQKTTNEEVQTCVRELFADDLDSFTYDEKSKHCWQRIERRKFQKDLAVVGFSTTLMWLIIYSILI